MPPIIVAEEQEGESQTSASLPDTATQVSALPDPMEAQIQLMGLSRVLSKKECGALGHGRALYLIYI